MYTPRYIRRFSNLHKNGMLHGLGFLYKTNSLIRHSSSVMKAVSINSFGDPSVLQVKEVALPVPRKTEVLVKVNAAGINPVDIYLREGAFMSLPPLPMILGKEAAGIIEAVGSDVTDYKEGDRVTCCLPGNGGYAEYVACDHTKLIPIPKILNSVQSSSLYVSYFVALRALITKCKIKKGEILLVHGASGGVGTAAIQIAKAKGLTVVGTASSPLGRKVALQAGADYVFDHKKESYLVELYATTEAKGFNVILENSADSNLGEDFMMLARSGRIAIVGTRGPVKPLVSKPRLIEVNPRSLTYTEGSVHAVNLLGVTMEEFQQYSSLIIDGINDGWLRPIIGMEFKLTQAPEAHTRMGEFPAAGKLVFNLEL